MCRNLTKRHKCSPKPNCVGFVPRLNQILYVVRVDEMRGAHHEATVSGDLGLLVFSHL